MHTQNYSYYCLDGAGQLHDAEWLYAQSDEDAVAKIEADLAGTICEIWQGNRLVAKISPKRRSA